ncbi:hypothetical protein Pstr01_30610 [Pseudomonas straminea]|nr:hypothetical protein Pstr01_30610 [Pseudomonas straminea]
MPIDDSLQGLCKSLQTLRVGHREVHTHHIGIATAGTDVVVEDAFLQRRQRIDVLDVYSAAGDQLDQTVDGHLVDGRQGQHLRGDACAVGGDAIGR